MSHRHNGRLYDDSGILQAVMRPSAGVPTADRGRTGWATDGDGVSYVTTDPVIYGSYMVDGLAYSWDGALHITTTRPTAAARNKSRLVRYDGVCFADGVTGAGATDQVSPDGRIAANGALLLNFRQGTNSLLRSDANTVANYQGGVSMTGASWANQIGAAGAAAQGTGSLQPAISGNSLIFDGTDDFLQTALLGAAMTQPCTFYMVAKQVTWTLNDTFFDGAAGGVIFYQADTTPRFRAYAGTAETENAGWAVGQTSILTFTLNGASSTTQVDSAAAVTSAGGAASVTRFTFGNNAAGTQGANIQQYEFIARNGLDSATTQAQIRAQLKAMYGTP